MRLIIVDTIYSRSEGDRTNQRKEVSYVQKLYLLLQSSFEDVCGVEVHEHAEVQSDNQTRSGWNSNTCQWDTLPPSSSVPLIPYWQICKAIKRYGLNTRN